MSLTVSSLSIKDRLRYFFKFYHKQVVIAAIAFVLLCVLIMSMTYCGFLMPLIEKMVHDICDTKTFIQIRKDLEVNIGMDISIGGTAIPGVGSMLTTLNSTIKGVAGALLGILFMVSLGTYVMNNPQPSVQVIVTRFVILIVSFGLVNYSMELSTMIGNAGSALVTQLGADSVDADTNCADEILAGLSDDFDKEAEEGAKEAENMSKEAYGEDTEHPDEDSGTHSKLLDKFFTFIKNLFAPIGKALRRAGAEIRAVFTLLIPWIIVKVCTALCRVFTISRAVELIILAVMSPLPASLMLNDPFGSGSFTRFLKNLAALSLQGAVMLIIAYVCQIMINNTLSTCSSWAQLGENVWVVIGICFAEIGLLMKSLGIAQKLVGIQ